MLDGDSDQGKPALGWFVLGMIVGNLVMYAALDHFGYGDKTRHMEDTMLIRLAPKGAPEWRFPQKA